MPQTIYILLGKTSDLAYAELENLAAIYNWQNISRYSPQLAIVEGVENPEAILDMSGGSVKVFSKLTSEGISTEIANDLISNNQAHFALSTFQMKVDLKTYANQIRALLHEAGIKPHFRLLETPYASAGIGEKSTEYVILINNSIPLVLKTIAVQNMRYWSIKDYDRPAIDPRSGMLPPKVARMMVNLGLTTTPSATTLLYDPFCGSGTILMEGLDSSLSVVGSDISTKAAADSQKNCEWFTKKYPMTGTYRVFQDDATHVNVQTVGSQVDMIVFEGYLGPPSPDIARLPNIAKGLEKLYKGTFKNLNPLLKPNGKIVCALPEFMMAKGVKNFDSLIDWTLTLGYTRCSYFTYGRPQAIVKRAIYVLQKNAS